MSALLLGSISTLADTSELQRQAFNQAFAQHGLDWEWSQADYAAMLGSNGGADRVASFADSRGEQVDADAVHATKSEIFQQLLGQGGVEPRAGVAEAITTAHDEGFKVGLVTTTSPENVSALLSALSPAISADSFDLVVDKTMVEAVKPDPAAYAFALDRLGEQAGDCVAVEDNPGGVQSASAAGITVLAFPNTNTAGSDFPGATQTIEALDPAQVRELAGA